MKSSWIWELDRVCFFEKWEKPKNHTPICFSLEKRGDRWAPSTLWKDSWHFNLENRIAIWNPR